MKTNIIEHKSSEFAVRIVRLRRYLNETHREFTIANQVVRSGTSIMANIAEAQYAFSRADFAYKMSIALKECNETKRWLWLLWRGHYLTPKQYASIRCDCREILAILIVIVRTAKRRAR